MVYKTCFIVERGVENHVRLKIDADAQTDVGVEVSLHDAYATSRTNYELYWQQSLPLYVWKQEKSIGTCQKPVTYFSLFRYGPRWRWPLCHMFGEHLHSTLEAAHVSTTY